MTATTPMNNDQNLPDDIAHPMLAAVREAPAGAIDAMAERFMKSRLMTRVADFERGAATLTVSPTEGVWEKFSPRIKIKVLKREADGSCMSYLLKLEAGAFLVPHKHSIDEECVVLEGELTIGNEQVGPGTYHLAPRGLIHAAIRSEHGATLFIRGKEPSWRDTAVKETLRALLR